MFYTVKNECIGSNRCIASLRGDSGVGGGGGGGGWGGGGGDRFVNTASYCNRCTMTACCIPHVTAMHNIILTI